MIDFNTFLKFIISPAGHIPLPLRSIYSLYIVYLAIHSLVLSIFGLFQDFAPIPMYGENEKSVIPT